MSLNNGGGRRRRRPSPSKKDDYITPSLILAGMLLALYYLYTRWHDNRITRDEIITVSIALVISAVCFVCYLPATQRLFVQMEHGRLDAKERNFWKKREANEKVQRLKEQQAEEARAQRHARRREEALQRQLEQSQRVRVAEDTDDN